MSLLPWPPGRPPLMLAPMQGLTNKAMRSLFIEWVRPDVVFTEFMRVNAAAPVRRLSAADLRDIAPDERVCRWSCNSSAMAGNHWFPLPGVRRPPEPATST